MTLGNQSQEKSVNAVYMLNSKKTSPVVLNNLGAKLIILGSLPEALRCLTDSMRIVRNISEQHHKKGNRNTREEVMNLTCTSHSSSPQKLTPPLISLSRGELARTLTIGGHPRKTTTETTTPFQRPRKKGGRHGDNSNQENIVIQRSLVSTYIFTDPVLLEDNKQCFHRHRRCLVKLTAIICFNLGLVHHLLGRSIITTLAQGSLDFNQEKRNSLRRNCVVHLKRAIGFYTISCRIQICHKGVALLDPVLAMAQLNNLAQIHDTLGNVESSKRLFERLLSNLVLHTEFIRNKANAKVERKRLSGFYRNTARFVLQCPKLAPAA